MSTKPTSASEKVSLREYLERIVAEVSLRVEQRFTLAEKATDAAFTASEKAILKAEEAQRDYNHRSNEFRAQLDDQAKTLMRRIEALDLFTATGDKIEAIRIFFDSKLETQRVSFEKDIEALAKEIAALREYRSEVSGGKTSHREIISYLIAFAGVMVGVASVFYKG